MGKKILHRLNKTCLIEFISVLRKIFLNTYFLKVNMGIDQVTVLGEEAIARDLILISLKKASLVRRWNQSKSCQWMLRITILKEPKIFCIGGTWG